MKFLDKFVAWLRGWDYDERMEDRVKELEKK